jgi:hypothetical protein
MARSILERIHQRFLRWLIADPSAQLEPLCNFAAVERQIAIADVLLVEGRSRVSEVIKVVTQSSWSHSALCIGRLSDYENPHLRQRILEHYQSDLPIDDRVLLIESHLGRGTIISPIDHYRLDNLRLCRPKDIAPEDAHEVISFAIGCLGLEYDVRQILDLARYLFPWSILPRRWRSSLFRYHAGQATRMICSTLIAEAFARVNFPILPSVHKDEHGMHFIRRNPRLVTPSSFDYSPYFDVMKFPLYNLTIGQAYRSSVTHDEVPVATNKTIVVDVPERVEVIRMQANDGSKE